MDKYMDTQKEMRAASLLFFVVKSISISNFMKSYYTFLQNVLTLKNLLQVFQFVPQIKLVLS